jgi:hypothetical protein
MLNSRTDHMTPVLRFFSSHAFIKALNGLWGLVKSKEPLLLSLLILSPIFIWRYGIWATAQAYVVILFLGLIFD